MKKKQPIRFDANKTARDFQALNPGLFHLPLSAKPTNENNHHGELPNPKPKRNKKATLGRATQGEEKSLQRIRVRFTGYRVRPLDPDNFAGSVKDLLDGLRHAQILPGDEPWTITLETEQVKVAHFKNEKTVIEIDNPNV